MKQIYEFDTTMQPAEQTQSELEAAIGTFKQVEGLDSLQIHTKRTSKAKKLIEGFLTWGAGDLTEGQLAAVAAILEAQPGLIGYINPTPEPIFTFNCENIVGATLDLPDNSGPLETKRIQVAAGDGTWGNFTYLGYLSDEGAGDVYTDKNVNYTGGSYTYLFITNYSGDPLTIPPGDLTITRDGEALVIDNQNPMTTQPIFGGSGQEWYYVDEDGKVYLAWSPQKGVYTWRTFEDAVSAGAV